MLIPLLSVRGGSKAIEFYKAAFDAEVLFRMEEEPLIAQLSIYGQQFWLSDESPEFHNFSPETLHGSTVRLMLIVDNPDVVFANAVEAGALVVWHVENQSYRWRLGRLVDPFGHHWEIGKPL
jgi:PhnB protein